MESIEFGNSVFEDVRMLQSICEDFREQDHTAAKNNTHIEANALKSKSKLYQ